LWRKINKWELLGKEKKSSKAGATTKKIQAAGEIKESNEIRLNADQSTIVEKLWGKHQIVRDERHRQFVGERIPLSREPLHGKGYPINQAESKEASRKLINC
jgi:hypothetical protein